jgi:hypothetical protein
LFKLDWPRAIGIVAAIVVAVGAWIALVPPARGPLEPRVVDGGYIPGGSECGTLLRSPQEAASKNGVRCRDALMEYRRTTLELVQQARSASAAEAANRLNEQQIRTGAAQAITGLFTLIAAVFAALYAKRAAHEANRGTNAAEASVAAAELASSLELRAYIGLGSYETTINGIGMLGRRREHVALMEVANFGQTPARNTAIRRTVVVTDEEPNFSWLTHHAWENLGIIPRDKSVEYRVRHELSRGDIAALSRPEFNLTLVGEIQYTDAFKVDHLYRFALTSADGRRWAAVSSDED